jgi:nicotinamide-nucleotide amidase
MSDALILPLEYQYAIREAAQSLSFELVKRGWSMGTAESCTGGGIAYCLTDLPGSSAWIVGGLVTYSNEMKQRLLGVPADILLEYGAVSEPVVRCMVQGALSALHCQLSLAVSGIAGPGGATPDKPVGTVCFAWSTIGESSLSPPLVRSETVYLPGNRAQVRALTVQHALRGALQCFVE